MTFSTFAVSCLLLSCGLTGVVALEKEGVQKAVPSRYVRYTEPKVNWTEAKSRCENAGWRLAEPDDDFFQFVVEIGFTANPTPYSGYWVGGIRNKNRPNKFLWVTTEAEIDYNWLPGEPNGYEGEDCVELKLESGWNNFYCDGLRGYICETTPVFKESKRFYGGSDVSLEPELKEIADYLSEKWINRIPYPSDGTVDREVKEGKPVASLDFYLGAHGLNNKEIAPDHPVVTDDYSSADMYSDYDTDYWE